MLMLLNEINIFTRQKKESIFSTKGNFKHRNVPLSYDSSQLCKNLCRISVGHSKSDALAMKHQMNSPTHNKELLHRIAFGYFQVT